MATLIFVDKENGEVGAPKNQLRLPSGSSKILSERTQVNTPLPKKTISSTPATSHSVRKALGNVNRTEGVTSKMEKTRQKNQPCTANKITEKTAGLESCDAAAEDWPETENMFPFDPQDFESFDLPEEHKISNINLRGVPLMIFERTYDRCVDMVPSPVKIEEISWESNLLQSTADFLATLDEIIDMPPPNYDF
ncbi:Securin [Buceros rhinoceros silvestris]|uniref:Securin n=1 Tax=Buceros rhinoceros silvestris TaxID=175836 RepID=A0A091HBR1_BUCRH|nr:PREDICTED: securin [Buceros rhinoceros silvestris]KFO92130.1 Securin [Buceros rhinoceros silvestris]